MNHTHIRRNQFIRWRVDGLRRNMKKIVAGHRANSFLFSFSLLYFAYCFDSFASFIYLFPLFLPRFFVSFLYFLIYSFSLSRMLSSFYILFLSFLFLFLFLFSLFHCFVDSFVIISWMIYCFRLFCVFLISLSKCHE